MSINARSRIRIKAVIIPVSFRKIPYNTGWGINTEYNTRGIGIFSARIKILQNTFKILNTPNDTPEY